jgi:hypothetical protein
MAQRMKRKAAEAKPPLEELLERSKESWREGDGLAYQRAIRGEWERSPEDVLPG